MFEFRVYDVKKTHLWNTIYKFPPLIACVIFEILNPRKFNIFMYVKRLNNYKCWRGHIGHNLYLKISRYKVYGQIWKLKLQVLHSNSSSTPFANGTPFAKIAHNNSTNALQNLIYTSWTLLNTKAKLLMCNKANDDCVKLAQWWWWRWYTSKELLCYIKV